MAGWHHLLNGHEFEWTPGVGDGQGGLACCNSWGCKESDMTEWLNWTELNETDSHEIWKVVEKKLGFSGGSAVMQEMEEMQFWSLGWEDPLEKEMTIYSSILAWQIPRTEEPGELQSMGSQRVGLDWATNTFTFNEHRVNTITKSLEVLLRNISHSFWIHPSSWLNS